MTFRDFIVRSVNPALLCDSRKRVDDKVDGKVGRMRIGGGEVRIKARVDEGDDIRIFDIRPLLRFADGRFPSFIRPRHPSYPEQGDVFVWHGAVIPAWHDVRSPGVACDLGRGGRV